MCAVNGHEHKGKVCARRWTLRAVPLSSVPRHLLVVSISPIRAQCRATRDCLKGRRAAIGRSHTNDTNDTNDTDDTTHIGQAAAPVRLSVAAAHRMNEEMEPLEIDSTHLSRDERVDSLSCGT